jgi:hypothetical protein
MWRYWHKPSYWRWWWNADASREAKVLLALGGTALVGLGGYAAGTRAWFSRADAGSIEISPIRSVEVKRELVTVSKVVTVLKNGHIRRKLVPVVRKVAVPAPAGVVTVTTFRASDQVRTLTAPAAFRPPVTVDGSPGSEQPRTVISTRVRPTTVTETKIVNRPQTAVGGNTVTQQVHAVTVTRTATQTETQIVPKTATESQTVAVTTTVPVTTFVSVITTVIRTTTVTDTVAVTVTAMVTVPLTVTVPGPPPHP